MGKSNKKAKELLIQLYGEECFIDKLNLRPKPTNQKYKSKGQRKRMKQLTYHHIKKKEHGGRATVENGALLSAENHEWFNSLPIEEQERLNNIFQEYKMGVIQIQDGRVVQAKPISISFSIEDCITIPLEPNRKKDIYNRNKTKRETRKALEEYFEGER